MLLPSLTLRVVPAPAPEHQGKVVLERAREGLTSRFVLGSIWRAHRVRLLCALVLQLCYSGIQFAGPLLLNQIIRFLSTPKLAQTVGALPAGGRGSLPFCARRCESLAIGHATPTALDRPRPPAPARCRTRA